MNAFVTVFYDWSRIVAGWFGAAEMFVSSLRMTTLSNTRASQ
jgi:hypothetical protein